MSLNFYNTDTRKTIIKLLDNHSDAGEGLENNFVDSIISNTEQLLEVLRKKNIVEDNENITTIKSITYKTYNKLDLPIYLLHFIKQCMERKVSYLHKIHINSYSNLSKENEYKIFRLSNSMILFWRRVDENMYAILSVMLKHIDETDFDQHIYFTHKLNINNVPEWKRFNTLTQKDLLGADKLLSLGDALEKLATIN